MLACAHREASVDAARAPLVARMWKVQRAACLAPSEHRACDPSLRLELAARTESSFARDGGWVTARKVGAIWCEDGRPRGRFSSFDGPGDEVVGDFGEAVWEAIWRVVETTDSCVAVYGAPVVVTRDGRTRSCQTPEFEMHELVERARGWAKRGDPVFVARDRPRSADLEGICAIDPAACASPMPHWQRSQVCPPFEGDLWGSATDADAGAPISDGIPDGIPDGPYGPCATDGEPADGGCAAKADAAPSSWNRDVVRAFQVVLPKAKRCYGSSALTGPIPTASVTFRPDGTVAAVNVRSATIPEPVAQCIRDALRRAKVPRSDSPSRTVSVTVRP